MASTDRGKLANAVNFGSWQEWDQGSYDEEHCCSSILFYQNVKAQQQLAGQRSYKSFGGGTLVAIVSS